MMPDEKASRAMRVSEAARASLAAGLATLLASLCLAAPSAAQSLETQLVHDINPGPSGSVPVGFTDLNGFLYFSADDGPRGSELWRTNGVQATLVKDITPGNAG